MSSSALPPSVALSSDQEIEEWTEEVSRTSFSDFKLAYPEHAASYVQKLRELMQVMNLLDYKKFHLIHLLHDSTANSCGQFEHCFNNNKDNNQKAYISRFIELAFIWRYHQFTTVQVNPDTQGVVVQMSQEEGMSYLEMLAMPSSNTLLHTAHDKLYFESLEKCNAELAAKYLKMLADLFQCVKLAPKSDKGRSIVTLINNKHDEGSADRFVELMDGDDTHRTRFIQLAFLGRYPSFYHQFENNSSVQKEVVEKTTAEGNSCLEGLISPQSNAERDDMELVAEAFKATYKGSEQIVEPIFNILCQYASDWSSTKYHSPYTSIIGPTMIGKSRLLRELAHKTCVVYICLRPEGSSGFPPRSKLAGTMIDPSRNTTSDYYARFLAAILQVVIEYFRQNKSNNAFVEWAEYHSSTESDFAKKVHSQLTQNLKVKRPLETAATDVKTCPFFNNFDLKVLFAIDEARSLLEPSPHDEYTNYFRMFRRALKEIPENCGIFTVVVDTASRVSNFNPAPRHDPSARIHDPQSNTLYDPLYKIRTFDKLVDTTPPKDLNELAAPKRLVGYGVPYFGIHYPGLLATKGQSLAETQLLRFALRKLICSDKEEPPPLVTRSLALAFLGPTIGIYLRGAPYLSAELTASHAAHCSYLDPKNELQFSYYPSQPVYAAATNSYFRSHEDILVSCIDHLISILRQGLISTGDVGEVAGRIILLCAMNKTLSDSSVTHPPERWKFPVPVKVESFLETLTGKMGQELYDCLGPISVQNRKKLLAGLMFWNHFQHSWDTPITRKYLLENLFRGVALQCKDTQQAYDEVLSIYLPDPTQTVIKEENMTICGVQVKNRQKDDRWKCPQALTPKKANITIDEDKPYLVIYISLQSAGNTASKPSGSNNSEAKISNQEGRKLRETDVRKNRTKEKDIQAFLLLRGLDELSFLHDRMRGALHGLLSTHSDLQSMHDGDELGVNYANDFMGRVVYDYSES